MGASERWVLAKEKIEESLKRMPKCEEMLGYKRACQDNELKKEVEVKRETKVELKELLSYADNKVLLEKAYIKGMEVLHANPEDAEAYYLQSIICFRQGELEMALYHGAFPIPSLKTCLTPVNYSQEVYRNERWRLHLQRAVGKGGAPSSYSAARAEQVQGFTVSSVF